MIIIPAIDIRNGKVVRLVQGDYRRETVYSNSPLEIARKWDSYGVKMIHIVDLDGALAGEIKNLGIVRDIAGKVKARVELGGGIRSYEAIKAALDAGVDKVVLGTMALDEGFLIGLSAELKKRVVVSIDAKEGFVRTKGWLFKSKLKVASLAKRLESFGVETINYTDISKDGMLEGPNLKAIGELVGITKISIVAAGGVSTLSDIKALKRVEGKNLTGAIIGKALYEGKIDLAEAIKVC